VNGKEEVRVQQESVAWVLGFSGAPLGEGILLASLMNTVSSNTILLHAVFVLMSPLNCYRGFLIFAVLIEEWLRRPLRQRSVW
jgi:hypothetical protein